MTQEKIILKEQSEVLMRIDIHVPEDRDKHNPSFPCIVMRIDIHVPEDRDKHNPSFPCIVFVLLLPAAYIRTYVHSRMAKCLHMEKM